MHDFGTGAEGASLRDLTPPTEPLPTERIQTEKTWKVEWRCEKWHHSADHQAGHAPDEVVVACDNLLVTGGIGLLLNRLVTATPDASYPAYGTSAVIKVGDSATAAASGDSDLKGGNTAEQVVDGGYPTVLLTTATWRATFGTTSANFAWNEVGVKNQAGAVSSTVVLLNRKVQVFGTKASGTTWQMTLSITIS